MHVCDCFLLQKRVGKQLGNSRPVHHLAFQAGTHAILELEPRVLVVREALAGRKVDACARIGDSENALHRIQVGERSVLVDHLVQNDAERPYVTAASELHRPGVCLAHGFWRHVAECADLVVSLNVCGVIVGDRFRDAEVDQLEAVPDEQEVCRLQVAVHDSLFVHHLHRLQHLLPEPANVREVQVRLRVQEAREVAVAELHEHEQLLLADELVVHDLDDVGLPHELLQQVDLVLEQQKLLQVVGDHALQREHLARARVGDLEHLRAPAAPDHADLAVSNVVHVHHLVAVHNLHHVRGLSLLLGGVGRRWRWQLKWRTVLGLHRAVGYGAEQLLAPATAAALPSRLRVP
mmetsp:Transcript_21483/g.54070  ORF Transcript_21483/g.54070 Transcript_21483/m.54070 type:complete len:349 (-) Transcript_21483:119-1165(-)